MLREITNPANPEVVVLMYSCDKSHAKEGFHQLQDPRSRSLPSVMYAVLIPTEGTVRVLLTYFFQKGPL